MTTPHFESVRAADGVTITLCHLPPASSVQARAVVILAPAMGVRQDFYLPFAQWLSEQGIVAYTFDYRGSGRSIPSTGLRGFDATIHDWARLDCVRVIDHARAHHPELPILWIGHSVGAQLLGLIPGANDLAGMLSIAAGSGYHRFNAAPLRYYVKPLFWSAAVPIATSIAGYFPGRRLRMVGDLPRGVALQWRAWCLQPDYLGSEGTHVRALLASVSVPITAWLMSDDEMMTPEGAKALFSLYSGTQVALKQLRPRDYGAKRIGHFGFFRRSMQNRLWPLALQWIDEVASGQQTAQRAA